jgi:nucleotide-binding universal stress UspA family protein
MTTLLIAAVALLAIALAVVAVADLRYRARTRRPRESASSGQRILFPFTARGLSRPALDAALRLARVEHATVAPVFLASVPLHLPLDTPLPRQCSMGMPLLEAIEQRAATYGVPVDARIERGRDRRHALRETIAHERYDRIVIAASGRDSDGFRTDDIAWLLDHAPGELIVLRPAREEPIAVETPAPPAQNGSRALAVR